MKKLSILGKSVSVPILAILMSAILITASAALLTYYGTITTEVDVEQSLKLDGLSWPDSGLVTESVSGVAGNAIPGDPHWLTNMADKIILASLTSTETGCPTGGEGGLAAAFPVFELDAMVDDDAFRLVLADEVLWGTITGISFNYFIELGPCEWIPQINIRLLDASGDFAYYASWHSFRTNIEGDVGVEASITYDKGDFYLYDSNWGLLGLYKDYGDQAAVDACHFEYFSHQAGETSIDPNPPLKQQIVWVSNHVVEGGPDIVGIGLYPDDTQEVLNFFMMYVFHDPAIPGIYTITTNVEPLYP